MGIGSGVFAMLATFQPAAEEFRHCWLHGVFLEIIWFLGVSVGLWRGLPGGGAARDCRPSVVDASDLDKA
jgi:hypothetical protein